MHLLSYILFAKDFKMTCTWLTYELHMTFMWLAHNSGMIVMWLEFDLGPFNLPLTCIIEFVDKTETRYQHNLLKICTWLEFDLHNTWKRLNYNDLQIILWFAHVAEMTPKLFYNAFTLRILTSGGNATTTQQENSV